MCDFSRTHIPTDFAKDGDDLVCYRFRNAMIGFARAADLEPRAVSESAHRKGFWAELKEPLFPPDPWTPPAICVPPGARLILMDIPESMREQLDVGRVEEVSVTEIAALKEHLDAVQFDNRRQVPVRSLLEGQRVRVLSISPETVRVAGYSSHGLPEATGVVNQRQ